jgi:hypothetical protein
LSQLEEQHGKLPPTRMAMSPSESLHYYFKHPGGTIKIKNSSSKLAPGVDVRGDGGMVIAPPSVRTDGTYRWLNELEIADPPQWLLDRVIQPEFVARDFADNGDSEANHALIAEALNVIPNDDVGWDEWNRIGMATWRATGGGNGGFIAFDRFSQKSGKYVAATTSEKWDSYSRSQPKRIGAGTILWMADQADPHWFDPVEDRLVAALYRHDDEIYESLYGVKFTAEPIVTASLADASPVEQSAKPPPNQREPAQAQQSNADPVDLWGKFDPPPLPDCCRRSSRRSPATRAT